MIAPTLTIENGIGFRVILTYPDSADVLVQAMGPDVMQVLVPEEHRPTTVTSQADCISRQVFDVNVIGLINFGNVEVGSAAGQEKCGINTPRDDRKQNAMLAGRCHSIACCRSESWLFAIASVEKRERLSRSNYRRKIEKIGKKVLRIRTMAEVPHIL